ncbi:Ig-like domain-containing protein [Vibrio sp. Vb339]|uniref:Ig-like domain-containing protein n=1 Tax=Vibrio sp. Vb339 TaxID=1192013 RepID=UPI0015575656|nr:Ig-like domain-containing protein [Vibrio sp. Vb339]
MSPLEQQKAKQDGVFSKALRDASNAFVQMGAHPRTLLHHSRRNDLIEQAIAKLHLLKREGDAYHQMGNPALQATPNIDAESKGKLTIEPVGFRKVDDSPVVYSELGVDVQNGGLNFVLNNPYEQIVKYTSSDESVATVDEKSGLITPVGDGEVTIHVALTKKGEYPRVEDSVGLVIADEPKEDSEPSPDGDAQSDNNASESGLDK